MENVERYGMGLLPSETRRYINMLLRAIEVTTDKTTENVLSAVLTLRELTITETRAINVADKADMKEGVSTTGIQNAGVKSPVPTNKSALSRIAERFRF